jgi:hypothetical protein
MDTQILNEVTEDSDAALWISSNNIKFRLKKVSRMVVADAGRKLKNPRIPIVMNEDKGREEENPNHPDYVAELEDVNYRRGMLAVEVYLALGTEVIERPADICSYEAEEWAQDLGLFGLEIPQSGKARYVAWLKYHALNDDDMTALTLAAMRFGGATLEEDVEEAQAGFWDSNPG